VNSERGLQLRCEELVELVTDYLEGAITDPDRLELIEAHLQLCDPCVVYVEQMRQTIAELGQIAPANVIARTEQLSDPVRAHLLDAFRAQSAS
jgi:anti-sigma factor RsiW